jgi:hypothetical protein
MNQTMMENRTRYSEQIERIRANPDLSDEAKRRQIAAVHEEATQEHLRLVKEEREETQRALEQMERKLLGISYPENARPHEKAIIALSYRDARDRVERAASDKTNPEALVELLTSAETSGDTQLAEAAFHVATVRGNRSVADSYLAKRPKVQSRWESYVEARKEAESLGGLVNASVTPPRPQELGR